MKTLVNSVAVIAMLIIGFSTAVYAPSAEAARITCEQAWIKQLNRQCQRQAENVQRRLPKAITAYKSQEEKVESAERDLAQIVEQETYLRDIQEEGIRELSRSEKRFLDGAFRDKQKAQDKIDKANERLAVEENKVTELIMQLEAAGFNAESWRNRFRDAKRSAKRILN